MADQENKHDFNKEPSTNGLNQPTLSSSSKKRHRRMTDNDVPLMPGSSSSSPMLNSVTVSSSSSQTSISTLTAPSTCTSPNATPRVSTRFPVRIGITWKKGEKLEAMDFSRTWYPSKIVEIDEAAKYVLIHFEGWNQRYDEWVPMDSEKLRPVTRHSERKDKGIKKRRIHLHPIYRPGEKVLAKWTDCKKYPAKISRLKEDGMYEVIFYDGVTRLIQPMNIQPMPEGMKDLKTIPSDVLPAPRTKLSFKQIKVTLPESVRRVKEKLEKNNAPVEDAALDKNKVPDKSFVSFEKNKVSNESEATEIKNKLSGPGKQPVKNRILQKRKFHSQKSGLISSKNIVVPNLDREQRIGSGGISKKRPYSWKILKFKKLSPEFPESEMATKPSNVELTEKLEISSKDAAVSASTATLSTSTTPSRKSITLKETVGPDLPQAEVLNPVVDQTEEQTASCSYQEAQNFGAKRTKKRSNTVPHFHQRRKRRSKSKNVGARTGGLTKRHPMLGQIDRTKSLDGGSNIASLPAQNLLPMPVFVPSKAFIVEEDHNPFKCSHQGCNKDFRKESLLAYHIKYYHTEVEQAAPQTVNAASLVSDRAAGVTSPLMPPSSLQSPGGTPGVRKRRKKTSSICSTDSDVSISSRGRPPSKRQHHDSEISVTTAISPDVLNRDLWADSKPLHTNSMSEEFVAVDTEDEEMEADVVNCICGQRETNGLMIQCDVCMCWQHFACVDSSNSGVPPANYVCHVCEKTPGIRDSCRYMCDMGWERRGELPSFPFVNESSSEHLRTVACECNDMISALLAIKSALHSTRRQIKISKEDADPEFQLWQTDWDNWTKAEEDLTLTPRSGDPDPSPTPSTFLFPQAPCSNTVTSMAEASSPAVPVLSDHILLSVPHVRAAMPTTPPSSSQNSHLTMSLTTAAAVLEATSVIASPSLVSQTSKLSHLAEALTSSAIMSPSGNTVSSVISNTAMEIPQTFSVHNSPLTSSQGQTKNVAKEIVSDNSTKIFHSLSRGGCLISQTDSSAHNQLYLDGKLTAKSDCQEISKLPMLSGNDQFTKTSAASQSQGTSYVTSQPHGISSATSQSQEMPSAILSESTAVQDEAKTNTQDMNINRESTVTSSGLVMPQQRAPERQDQLLSSYSLDKTDSTTEAEIGVGNVDNHMTSLYVEISGSQGHQVGCHDDDEDDDAPDNDTDTAEESLDPYRNCEHNLLVHVSRVHSDIEKQLESLEQQITELENSEHNNPTVQLSEDNILNDLPALKKSLSKLHRNLIKVQKFCVHH